jgi:hypothetical protein
MSFAEKSILPPLLSVEDKKILTPICCNQQLLIFHAPESGVSPLKSGGYCGAFVASGVVTNVAFDL